MSWIARTSSASLLGLLAGLPLALLGCWGPADTMISGVGNGGNVIGLDTLDRLARELANDPAIPAVSDDDLRAAFAAIRERALAGDPEAALVLLRVAAHQRDPSERE